MNENELRESVSRVMNFRDRYKEWAEKDDTDENVSALNNIISFVNFYLAVSEKMPKPNEHNCSHCFGDSYDEPCICWVNKLLKDYQSDCTLYLMRKCANIPDIIMNYFVELEKRQSKEQEKEINKKGLWQADMKSIGFEELVKDLATAIKDYLLENKES